jgi:Cys-rich protein (TIGR01571 family)
MSDSKTALPPPPQYPYPHGAPTMPMNGVYPNQPQYPVGYVPYQPQPPMTTIPGGPPEKQSPQSVTHPGLPTFKQGEFTNTLCSCCNDPGTCCLGCWCPCILYGHTHARLQNPALTREQLPCCSGACCGFAAVMMFCPPFQCIFGWMQRGDIRNRYGIEGGECGACLTHTFCDCCVWPLLRGN